MSIADQPFMRRTGTVARRLLADAMELATPGLTWLLDNFPILGRTPAIRRRRIVLAPYTRTHTLFKSLLILLAAPALLLACLVFGFFYGLTAPYYIVPCAIPIALLVVMIIWALPDQRTAPTLGIEALFPAFFIVLILWPNYLAVSLKGLPWITFARLISMPMAALMLVSLSVSSEFRKRVSDSVNGVPLLWRFFLGFTAVELLTIIVSSHPNTSAQQVFNQQIYWTNIFVISCVLFRDLKYVEKYWALLCLLAAPIILVTALESSEQHILWVAHIPDILKVDAPSVQVTLKPSFRPGIHLYRAKATFSTPLGLAEYISLMTPFFLHFGFWSRKRIWKIAAFAMIPATFIAVRMTDARLGVVGMLVSVLLYGVFWSIVRWRSHSRDLLAAATVYAYPTVFLAGLGLVFASHRLNLMVFGDGAQASSTAARATQLGMAIDKLLKTPWGHGAGQGGLAMGYGEGAFITIDNYFITVSLDYGILGILFWYGTFLIGIFEATRYSISSKYAGRKEARLLAPLAVALSAFLIIKWVHGQDDNHPIIFMMLGMVCALIYRLRNEPAPSGPVESGEGPTGIQWRNPGGASEQARAAERTAYE